jgi:hypothetical protein
MKKLLTHTMAAGGDIPHEKKPLIPFITKKQALQKGWLEAIPKARYMCHASYWENRDYLPFFPGWGDLTMWSTNFSSKTNSEVELFFQSYIKYFELHQWMRDYIHPLVMVELLEVAEYDHMIILLDNEGRSIKPDEGYMIMSFIENTLEKLILDTINPRAEKDQLPFEAYALREFYYLMKNNLEIVDRPHEYHPYYEDSST